MMRLLAILGGLLFLLPGSANAADIWKVPTAAELTMTSIAEVPGTSAVILYKEEKTVDRDRATSVYVRIKILNQSGVDHATVELPFGGVDGIHYQNLAGRTIHSDGTIYELTDKPYEKVVEKLHGSKVKVLIFALPSVNVGSIIEYRYKIAGAFGIPDRFVQSDLFTSSAHYEWAPEMFGVAWTPILSPGVKVESNKTGSLLTLDVQNIIPVEHDEMMPPLGSVSYRVLFYSTLMRSSQEFWKVVGKAWSETLDKFIGPDKATRQAVEKIVTPNDNDLTKMHKRYAAVMSYDNTDFDRRLTAKEVKARGFKDFKSAGDIVARQRGSGDQIAIAFVALARAARLKAYLMAVADRSERLFLENYMNLQQINDYIVIFDTGGVETFLDPAGRYTPFGQLAWFHTLSGGLRETATGTAIINTPSVTYTHNKSSRVADLVLDEHGGASGKIKLTFGGELARRWRGTALLGDETSLKTDPRSSLESPLPSVMEIAVASIGKLDDSESDLTVTFDVSGTIGSATGKRLLIPANLFQVNAKPLFPEVKRDVTVDMHFASMTEDSVRYKLPIGMVLESVPSPERQTLTNAAGFEQSSTATADSVTSVRNLIIGHVYDSPGEYPDLRDFYKNLEARDQEMLVVTRAQPTTTRN